jgi:hypothetical protein
MVDQSSLRELQDCLTKASGLLSEMVNPQPVFVPSDAPLGTVVRFIYVDDLDVMCMAVKTGVNRWVDQENDEYSDDGIQVYVGDRYFKPVWVPGK